MSNFSLENYRIPQLPPSAYYIPYYISEAEESSLIKNVYSAPKPKWKHLSNRSLQNWGGLPHPKGMIEEPLPEWLNVYAKKMSDLGVFGEKTPNHVLVNEYHPGQGIMPHEDGPLFYPTITTINIGSHTVLDYYSKLDDFCGEGEAAKLSTDENFNQRYIGSLLLERRSLLVVQDDLYDKFLHGIKERNEDIITDEMLNLSHCRTLPNSCLNRDVRISLTIRVVPRTIMANVLFGKPR